MHRCKHSPHLTVVYAWTVSAKGHFCPTESNASYRMHTISMSWKNLQDILEGKWQISWRHEENDRPEDKHWLQVFITLHTYDLEKPRKINHKPAEGTSRRVARQTDTAHKSSSRCNDCWRPLLPLNHQQRRRLWRQSRNIDRKTWFQPSQRNLFM